MIDANVFDTGFALGQAGGDESLAKELLGMLLAELPELRDKLAAAIEQEDMEAIWAHAHKINGSTAYCGVPALRKGIQAVEQAIRAKDIQQIKQEFSETIRAIEQIMQQGPAAIALPWS